MSSAEAIKFRWEFLLFPFYEFFSIKTSLTSQEAGHKISSSTEPYKLFRSSRKEANLFEGKIESDKFEMQLIDAPTENGAMVLAFGRISNGVVDGVLRPHIFLGILFVGLCWGILGSVLLYAYKAWLGHALNIKDLFERFWLFILPPIALFLFFKMECGKLRNALQKSLNG